MAVSFEQRKEAVLAAFAADALSLGAHWNYDSDDLAAKFGEGLKEFIAPGEASMKGIHVGKKAGDFTHYGDQSFWLLEYFAKGGKSTDFFSTWISKAKSAPEAFYKDGATKECIEKGCAATENGSELAGASRIAPAFLTASSAQEFANVAAEVTAATHGDPLVIASARLFARIAYHVAAGSIVESAFTTALTEETWPDGFTELVEKGKVTAAAGMNDIEAGRSFGDKKVFGEMAVYTGLACGVKGALPLAVHFILKYGTQPAETALEDALVSNVMTAGDQAGRGMLIALVLGSRPGASVPDKWKAGLSVASEINVHFDTLCSS